MEGEVIDEARFVRMPERELINLPRVEPLPRAGVPRPRRARFPVSPEAPDGWTLVDATLGVAEVQRGADALRLAPSRPRGLVSGKPVEVL